MRQPDITHCIGMCHKCDGEWDQFCIEFPPQLTICTRCGTALKVKGYDPKTKAVAYEAI